MKIGDLAPLFSATDVKGKKVSIKDYHDKYLLVVFMRYAGCPWCNLAIHRLSLEHKLLLNSDCSVIAFVQSSKENIINNIFSIHEKKPPFPVISDQLMSTYAKYKVIPSALGAAKMISFVPHWVHAVRKGGYKQKNIDGSLFLVPAAFLITPYSRKILRADYSANMYDHETFSDVYNTIAEHKINGDA